MRVGVELLGDDAGVRFKKYMKEWDGSKTWELNAPSVTFFCDCDCDFLS